MTIGDAGPAATATGSSVAVAGAMIAGTTSADVGNAALIVATGGLITGVLGGVTQLFKLWLDAQSYSARVQKLESDLLASRERRHNDTARFNDTLLKLEDELFSSRIVVARLEGQLGKTEESHSTAINANSDNIHAIADQTGSTLPVPLPHVRPFGSSDDHDAWSPGRGDPPGGQG